MDGFVSRFPFPTLCISYSPRYFWAFLWLGSYFRYYLYAYTNSSLLLIPLPYVVICLRLAVERAVEGVSHANGFCMHEKQGTGHLDLLSLGNIG
jgi:hypothetical protein